MDEREARFDQLVAFAKEDPDVLGLYVFGSRGRSDGLSDERSDYDVGVVLGDHPGAVDRFDKRWPYVHGAAVEVTRATLAELRLAGSYGSPSEWSRPLYAQVDLLLDKTGEIAAVLDEKRRVPPTVRQDLVRRSLDDYINSTYRSLRYRMVGATAGARLDAAECIPPLLTAIFGIEGRVRPFNKYLAWELDAAPLRFPAWAGTRLVARLTAILDGSPAELHALFRDVHDAAAAAGYADVIDGWEPDVAWLRGEGEFRQARG